MKDRNKGIKKIGSTFWLKGLAILLILFLAFTVLSRIAASFTVAKVTVENISARKIQHTVQAEGVVEQNREAAVITEPDILVKSVEVKEGEAVEKGDVLFCLDLTSLSSQIESIENQIQTLKLQNSALEESENQAKQKRNTDIQRAKEDYDDTVKKNEEAVNSARGELEAAREDLTAAEEQLKEAKAALAREEQKGDNQEEILRLKDAAAEKENDCNVCKAAVSEKETALSGAMDTRQAEIKAAARNLEDAENSSVSDNSVQINEISIGELEGALEKLKKLEGEEGMVTAPEGGVITKLDVSVGQKTTDTAAVTMSENSAGFCFVAQIDSEDSPYVSVGDSVTLEGIGKSSEDGRVLSVEPDEAGELLEVTVALEDNVFSLGERAMMSVVRESQEYACTVPTTSLCQENNKMFILVPDQEDTVLGQQYVARKVEVKVLDKNAQYSALDESTLGSIGQVIKDMDRYVEAGDRIRLTEE